MPNVVAEAQRYTFLRDELLRRFPSLAEDDQALADTLEGISDLDGAIAAVVRSVEEDEILLGGIESFRLDLDARYMRIETRRDSKRDALQEAMTRAGKQKVELPSATIFLKRLARSVVVTDEALIPDALMVQPPAPPKRPDKRAIAELLKDGKTVAGCELSNAGQTLQWNKK